MHPYLHNFFYVLRVSFALPSLLCSHTCIPFKYPGSVHVFWGVFLRPKLQFVVNTLHIQYIILTFDGYFYFFNFLLCPCHFYIGSKSKTYLSCSWHFAQKNNLKTVLKNVLKVHFWFSEDVFCEYRFLCTTLKVSLVLVIALFCTMFRMIIIHKID